MIFFGFVLFLFGFFLRTQIMFANRVLDAVASVCEFYMTCGYHDTTTLFHISSCVKAMYEVGLTGGAWFEKVGVLSCCFFAFFFCDLV